MTVQVCDEWRTALIISVLKKEIEIIVVITRY
jgi:hypothetical protein